MRRVVVCALLYLVLGATTVAVVTERPPDTTRARLAAAMVVASAVCAAVMVPAGVSTIRRRFRRALAFANAGGGPPSAVDRDAVLCLPRRVTEVVAATGTAATVVVLGVAGAFFPWSTVARMLVGALVFVAGACFLAHVVAGSTLGPVVGPVVEPPVDDPRLGIVGRIGAAWAQGVAVPIAAIALNPRQIAPDPQQWFVVVVALILSFTAIVHTARSIARPLRDVRRAVQRVGRGDLDSEVAVEDGGEVGQLQVALRAMVAGLRQTDRLRQLFGRHVGEAVAERALAGGDGLGGERREITALFVDMVGSTRLASQVSPDEMVITLNAFYGVIVEVMEREGGFVNKFEGDAAVCVFGAPHPQSDHRSRALRAARALRSALDDLAAEFPRLDAGIGLSTGEVVAGNVGAAWRYEFTVIGCAVNEAARLCDNAKLAPGRVMASATTVMLATDDERRRWVPAGEARIRGMDEPVSVFLPATVGADCRRGGSPPVDAGKA